MWLMKCSRQNRIAPPVTVFLYDDPSSKTLDLDEIRDYLLDRLCDIEVKVRKDFITFHLDPASTEDYAARIAGSKVRNLHSATFAMEPLTGEVRYEQGLIKSPERKLAGVLYDGYRLDRTLRSLIPRSESGLNHAHIVFTNRLIGTFDEGDKRYHARVIICGYPSLISTTGIVEAPAKPREFYHLMREHAHSGSGASAEIDKIKARFKGRFIDYDDERLTDVAKGYVMQAIFYLLTFEPFCSDKDCRLYNSHWQEEMINAQLGGSEFCERHERFLQDLKAGRSHTC
jgi:hypothetical protein